MALRNKAKTYKEQETFSPECHRSCALQKLKRFQRFTGEYGGGNVSIAGYKRRDDDVGKDSHDRLVARGLAVRSGPRR